MLVPYNSRATLNRFATMSQRFEADTGGKRAAILAGFAALLGLLILTLSLWTTISILGLFSISIALIPIPLLLIRNVPRHYEVTEEKLIVYYWDHWRGIHWDDIFPEANSEHLLVQDGRKLRLYRVKQNQHSFNSVLLEKLNPYFHTDQLPESTKEYQLRGGRHFFNLHHWVVPSVIFCFSLGIIFTLHGYFRVIDLASVSLLTQIATWILIGSLNSKRKVIFTRDCLLAKSTLKNYSKLSTVRLGIDGLYAVFHFESQEEPVSLPVWRAVFLIKAMVAKNPNIKFTVSKSDQEILRLSGAQLPAPEPKATQTTQPTLP